LFSVTIQPGREMDSSITSSREGSLVREFFEFGIGWHFRAGDRPDWIPFHRGVYGLDGSRSWRHSYVDSRRGTTDIYALTLETKW